MPSIQIEGTKQFLTIRVLSLIGNLLTEVRGARSSVATTRLSVECLTTIAAEPLSEGFPSIGDVISDTFASRRKKSFRRSRQKLSRIMYTNLLVPELSLSRYLCTSNIRPVIEPSGLVTLARAAADPLDTKV